MLPLCGEGISVFQECPTSLWHKRATCRVIDACIRVLGLYRDIAPLATQSCDTNFNHGVPSKLSTGDHVARVKESNFQLVDL
jgi:hypothetical protein